jgi:hypothetical protein
MPVGETPTGTMRIGEWEGLRVIPTGMAGGIGA